MTFPPTFAHARSGSDLNDTTPGDVAAELGIVACMAEERGEEGRDLRQRRRTASEGRVRGRMTSGAEQQGAMRVACAGRCGLSFDAPLGRGRSDHMCLSLSLSAWPETALSRKRQRGRADTQARGVLFAPRSSLSCRLYPFLKSSVLPTNL